MIEGVSDCTPEVIDGPGADRAEDGFEFGKDLFDVIEVGAVGRQVKRDRADRLESLADAGDLMGTEGVHDDDIARR